MKRRQPFYIVLAVCALCFSGSISDIFAQRRITPVQAPSAQRAPVDSALIRERELKARRSRSVHYHDDQGRIIMVDTVTNTEWVDSTMLPKPPKMLYPLVQDLSIGVNIFDPLMRAFGQKYGGADVSASLAMHNRYFPTFEFGLGAAKNTPSGNNFTYHTPLSPYIRLGADYNFLYNSDPAYRLLAGIRYGFSIFKYSVDNVTLPDNYWQEEIIMSIPSTSVTAGWLEVSLGLRVRIWESLSAGWQVKYHSILHQTHPVSGNAWYIPGYGTSGSAISASFSLFYTFDLNKKKKAEVNNTTEDEPQEALP